MREFKYTMKFGDQNKMKLKPTEVQIFVVSLNSLVKINFSK